MGTLSFRVKLLLAMMLIVAGVTGATLFATQQRVRAAYQEMFEDQFEALINYFADKQEARLSVAKDKCSELARSVRFTAFFLTNENPDQEAIDDLYKTAQDELGGVWQIGIGKRSPSESSKAAASDPEKPPDGAAVFLRFLNAKGQVLQFQESRPPKPGNLARVDQQLAAISQRLSNVKEQETGYLTTEGDQLLEVIVIPHRTTRQKLQTAIGEKHGQKN